MASLSTGDYLENIKGFDCEFVEPPPDVLQTECPVCLLIIRDPYQVMCCGYNFCGLCIKKIKDNTKPCPACKKEGFSDFPDIRLKRTLFAYKVHCTYKKGGCEWTGELGQLEVHLNTDSQSGKELDGCQFVEIACLYKCGNQLQRRYMLTHQTEHCTKRPFSCNHCRNYESNYADVIHEHWPVCGSVPVPCHNGCGLELPRHNMDNHVSDECPLTTVHCSFHHVGCTVNLPRKDMSGHLIENLHTHTSLQTIKLEKHQATILSLEARVVELEARIREQETKTPEHNTAVAEQRDQIALLQDRTDKLQTEVTHLTDENDLLQSKITNLEQNCGANLTRLPEVPPKPVRTLSSDRLVLAMNNFASERSRRDFWFSPPVYTHQEGYKICLGVVASGYGSGTDTHVSLYVFFMRGECDGSLVWPFRGVISIQLLDQVDETDHVRYSVQYDYSTEDCVCARVQESERAEYGRGPHKFIAHDELSPKYLQNDTLKFQITSIQLHSQV